MPTNQEIEVRFLEIDTEALKTKLRELGAEDLGADLFQETVFHIPADDGGRKKHQWVKVRKTKDATFLTYKHSEEGPSMRTTEIETRVDDYHQTRTMLELFGLITRGIQEKKRHAFVLDGVRIDIDTWPRIPTWVELEGESEEALKSVAEKLGFDWNEANSEAVAHVMTERYGIPVMTLKKYTFDEFVVRD